MQLNMKYQNYVWTGPYAVFLISGGAITVEMISSYKIISIARVNHSGTETRLFWDNYVNTTTADAPTPRITRSSLAILLTMQDARVFTRVITTARVNSALRNDSKYKYL